MIKRLACLYFLVVAASPVKAQDISLSQILIDGEGWRRVAKDNKGEWDFAETLRKAGPPEVVAANGFRYNIDDKERQIRGVRSVPGMDVGLFVSRKAPDLARPAGITLWPDGRTLVVGDTEAKHLWAFRVGNDGALSFGDRYYALRAKPGQKESGVTALTVDSKGLLYACTALGVQVFDPTGRLSGVLLKPAAADPTAIAFGGPGRDQLFVVHGDEVFVRKLQAKGVAPAEKKP
jgi:hypothetical protein